MDCYQGSSPARRGYMARMHSRWIERHPDLQFSQQHLRDYVAYLRRIGYVRAPVRVVQENAALTPQRPPIHGRITQAQPAVDLGARQGNLRSRVSFKPQDMARVVAVLDDELPEDADVWQINCAVYNAAKDLLQEYRQERNNNGYLKGQQRIHKLGAKITSARQHASRVECVMQYIRRGLAFTSKIRQIANKLRRQHHTLNLNQLQNIKQHCLERIRVLTVAKKALVTRTKGIIQNNTFRYNPSRLFEPPQRAVENPPSLSDIENFWREIYESPQPCRADTPAVTHFGSYVRGLTTPGVECDEITEEEVQLALKGTKNFSAPGPDGINNFWWKKFTCVHRRLARVFNSWLQEERPIPQWFVEGRTVLIPKKGDLSQPKNYRPITCLNTCYKIFTRILYSRLLISVGPVFDTIYEQRGAKKGVAGCKENLLIDRCVTQDSRQYKRSLSMAWIDYRKAFDTTSHEHLLTLLRSLAIPPPLERCMQQLMLLWRTRFALPSGERVALTEPIAYKRGVFQGDSLSPLLFCISLLPLSVILRQTRGYLCGPPNARRHKVTHLFYMDDLKIYASGESDLHNSLRLVQDYTRDIGMSFGLDKCAVFHIQRGRCVEIPHDAQLADGCILKHLGPGETYAYLGLEQRGIQNALNIKESLRCRYKQILRKVWSSELSGQNKIAATNMLAVPIISFSFGIIKWNVEELRQLDRDTRKIMHVHRSLHPKSSVPRIYLPRQQGGRGLLGLECLHGRIVLGISCCVLKGSDPLLRLVSTHEKAGVGAFLFSAAQRASDELGLRFDLRGRQRLDGTPVSELAPQQMRSLLKTAETRLLFRQHVDRPMHGLYYRSLEEHGLSTKLTFSFLRSAGLRSETEGFIVACQDGVHNTLLYRSHVLGMEVPDVNCRACHKSPESLMHLLSACPVYAVSAYIHRHNAALRVLYYHLRHSYGIDETPVLPYAPGDIESVVENDNCRLYWNFSFATIRHVQANKPDIVLLDKLARAIYVIEFSAPAEPNVVQKEEEKQTKYQPLVFELKQLFPGHSVKIIVLIIGALGGIRNTMLQNIKAIPHCRGPAISLLGRMQKSIILGSLRLLRSHSATHDH